MATPMLNLFSQISESREPVEHFARQTHTQKQREMALKHRGTHAAKTLKTMARHGWALKSGGKQSSVFKHPHSPGHTIRVDHDTKEFTHTVRHSEDLEQHVKEHNDQRRSSPSHGQNWDRGRSGLSDGPGPRGYRG